MQLIRSLVPALLVLSATTPATGRPVRVFVLDSDVKEAHAILVGKVIEEKVVGQEDWQGQQLEILDIRFLVMRGFKNCRAGEHVTLRHRRARRTSQMWVNGWTSFPFSKNAEYLLFLVKNPRDHLELIAPEGMHIVRFPKALREDVARAKTDVGLLDCLLRLIERRIEYEPITAANSMWLLGGSRSYLDRERRPELIKSLVGVTKSSRGAWLLSSTYYLLGRLGETAVLDDLVEVLVSDATKLAISKEIAVRQWLQGFEKGARRAALKQIADRAKVDYVAKAAREALLQLR